MRNRFALAPRDLSHLVKELLHEVDASKEDKRGRTFLSRLHAHNLEVLLCSNTAPRGWALQHLATRRVYDQRMMGALHCMPCHFWFLMLILARLRLLPRMPRQTEAMAFRRFLRSCLRTLDLLCRSDKLCFSPEANAARPRGPRATQRHSSPSCGHPDGK